MRKLNKLIMTILPMSSLSVFSVVSCTTDTKNKPDKIPQIPNSKKPDKEHDPNNLDPNDKSDNENHNKEDNNPKKPEKPENSDNSNSNDHSSDSVPKEEPQADEASKTKIDFSDVKELNKKIDFQYFSTYNNKNADAAWVQIISRGQNIFKEIIFNKNKDILDKYTVEFDPENKPNIIVEKGIIDDIKIKFTKDSESITLQFSFIGFMKKEESQNDAKNNKNNYIKPNDKITEKLKGLYPSLIAYMLLYFEENHSNNKYDTELKQHGNVINFDELKNNNSNLFENDSVGFSVGTKELLLNYDKEYERLYKDRITEASFDDINGTLGLKIRIENRDENHSTEPTITKEFQFNGFRKVDFEDQKNNPFSVTLLQNDLKTILNEQKIRKSLEEMGLNLNSEITDFGVQSKNYLWETEIFKYLILDITDNKNHIYKSNQTLKIDPNSKKNDYKSILGIKPNMSLYPFNTMISKESIKDMIISIENKKVTLEFDLHIPVYATSFSDLITHTTNGKDLVIKIVQSTSI
ncbi:LppA family lipoprotein [Mycoplasma capricolum]|uniref:LppA family lipoprotein n=1 Tax=Mycoplasma capricolum TaxID=2095 RepID=UPI00062A32AF|nr:LppA family lipoprotein [Mycoplasma capricolum]KKW61754.1 Immunodominant Protein p72 precursor [Mycoplasma capricolum subsp. capricolum]